MDGAEVDTDMVALEETGLRATLLDGRPGYFNYFWLRDNCPASFDPETRERTFDIFQCATPPRPRAVRM